MADIDIPILEVAAGWDIDQVKTIQDCDDADALLTEATARIEAQLLEDRIAGFARGPKWRGLANTALKMKRRTLQAVATKRGQFSRAQRIAEQTTRESALLDVIKRDFPDQFHAAVSTFIAERGGQPHG